MASSLPDMWRKIDAVHRLVGVKCDNCGTVNFPSRKICAKCGSTELEKHSIPREGEIVTYSIGHRMPSGVHTPIAIGVIETEDGSRVTAWSTDCDPYDLEVGSKVKLILRRVGPADGGPINYGFKFRPIEVE